MNEYEGVSMIHPYSFAGIAFIHKQPKQQLQHQLLMNSSWSEKEASSSIDAYYPIIIIIIIVIIIIIIIHDHCSHHRQLVPEAKVRH